TGTYGIPGSGVRASVRGTRRDRPSGPSHDVFIRPVCSSRAGRGQGAAADPRDGTAPMSTTSAQSPRAILVLGMHRSGTSAVTRVLNLLGADLGSRLVAPAADNPAGFWEHADAVKINDDLLQALGRTWYDMRDMPANWLESDAA